MCTLFLAHLQHPRYPFVFIGNRDEAYERPTRRAEWWEEAPLVWAGRDLSGGGTWTGITRDGRFAALTNFRDPEHVNPDAPTRGHLVADFLTTRTSPEMYLNALHRNHTTFNGFNLVVGTPDALWYTHNVSAPQNAPQTPQKLAAGVYGLSNAWLDTPWPKVENGRMAFQNLLQQPDLSPVDFLGLMDDRTIFPDEILPKTGVPMEWERRLSALFITSPQYGTRITTLILVRNDGHTTCHERTFHPESGTFSFTETHFDRL